MNHRFYISLLLSIVLATQLAVAKDPKISHQERFRSSNQVGMRIGLWSSKGELPPPINADSSLISNLKNNNFYFEGYYGHRLTSTLMLEGSVGVVNRGSVTFKELGEDNVGNVMVYSILVQAKVYLLGMTSLRLQPYVIGGGGLYYGRRSVQFTSNYYYDYNLVGEETDTDFRYSFGGGADYPITSKLALDFNVKYMAINFPDKLISISNYDALAITVGLKYLWSKKTKKSKHSGGYDESRH